jgi:hypothetical protein
MQKSIAVTTGKDQSQVSKDKKSYERAINPSWSYVRIKKHLSVCWVLYKNCHTIRTYKNKDHLA